MTADALHCNRRTVAAITEGGGDYCLALKANQDSLLSDARSCFGKVSPDHPVARQEEVGHGRKETRTGMVASAKGPPVSGKLSAALVLLYFSAGRDRTMIWDTHRNVR